MTSIGFVGENYNFSYLAAQRIFTKVLGPLDGTNGNQLISCRNMNDLFLELQSGKFSYAVLPIESSSYGTIHNVYDKLLTCGNIKIVGELGLLEEYILCTKPEVIDVDITEIVAYPHALESCSNYLDHLDNVRISQGKPLLQRTGAWDSSAACLYVNDSTSQSIRAAITSIAAAKYHNLKIIDTAIGNDINAETRYLVLSKFDKETLSVIDPCNIATARFISSEDSNTNRKASIALALRNIPGAIFKMTSCFALRDINIIKIESRPVSTTVREKFSQHRNEELRSFSQHHWDLIFYVDYEPPIHNPDISSALIANLMEYSIWIRQLGEYNSGLSDKIPANLASWNSVQDLMSVCM